MTFEFQYLRGVFSVTGLRQWKPGWRCLCCPPVRRRWWRVPDRTELCQEHGSVWWTCWSIQYGKWWLRPLWHSCFSSSNDCFLVLAGLQQRWCCEECGEPTEACDPPDVLKSACAWSQSSSKDPEWYVSAHRQRVKHKWAPAPHTWSPLLFRELYNEWKLELKGMADRILRMRQELYDALVARGMLSRPYKCCLHWSARMSSKA